MKNSLPPFINALKQDSFAHFTLKYRFKKVVEDIILDNDWLEPEQTTSLKLLLEEVDTGAITKIKGLLKDEKLFWKTFEEQCLGLSYYEVSFFKVEVYFYRRIVAIVDYPENQIDPFLKRKKMNLEAKKNEISLLPFLLEGDNETEILIKLLKNSLWGNTSDLSQLTNYNPDSSTGLLEDDSVTIADYVLNCNGGYLDFILDNAGLELITDLFLVYFLVKSKPNIKIRLHVKSFPIFVSDALIPDFDYHINFLKVIGGQVKSIAEALENWKQMGQIQLLDNLFWNSPLFFSELNDELIETFNNSSLVILKGDANYRRLFEDRQWEYTTSVSPMIAGTAIPMAIIRVLKSEIVVGQKKQLIEELQSSNPHWLIDGSCGLISFKS